MPAPRGRSCALNASKTSFADESSRCSKTQPKRSTRPAGYGKRSKPQAGHSGPAARGSGKPHAAQATRPPSIAPSTPSLSSACSATPDPQAKSPTLTCCSLFCRQCAQHVHDQPARAPHGARDLGNSCVVDLKHATARYRVCFTRVNLDYARTLHFMGAKREPVARAAHAKRQSAIALKIDRE